MKKWNPNDEDSSVLVLVLILTTVLLVVAGSALEMLSREYNHSLRSARWNQALNLAEAGVDLAWDALNEQSSSTNIWNGWAGSTTNRSITTTFTAAGTTNAAEVGKASVTVTSLSNDWLIVSTGIAPTPRGPNTNVSRQVEVRLTPATPFSFGLLARGNINFNGNDVLVDSYDSTDTAHFPNGQYQTLSDTPVKHANLKGDVGTVGTQLNAGNSDVFGNLWVGVNGNILEGPKVYITGTQKSGLQVNIPDSTGPGKTIASSTAWAPTGVSADNDSTTGWPTKSGSQTTINDSNILGTGDYNISSISLSGSQVLTIDTTSGNVRMYVSGGISVSGKASIQILGTNSLHSVQIWNVGNVAIGGNGLISPETATPSQLKIFSKVPTSGTATFSISGNGAFKGAIYAPGHSFDINGGGSSGTVYGSVVAKTITLNGGANFHFDEALLSKANSSSMFDVVYWRETTPPAPN